MYNEVKQRILKIQPDIMIYLLNRIMKYKKLILITCLFYLLQIQKKRDIKVIKRNLSPPNKERNKHSNYFTRRKI